MVTSPASASHRPPLPAALPGATCPDRRPPGPATLQRGFNPSALQGLVLLPRLPARLVPSDFPRPRPALCGSERHLPAGKWFSPSPAPGLGPARASPLTWGWRRKAPGQLVPEHPCSGPSQSRSPEAGDGSGRYAQHPLVAPQSPFQRGSGSFFRKGGH